MKLTRPALVAAGAAALFVAVPATAASAQTVLHLDQTHDVRSLDMDSSTITREPNVPQGDVQAVAINHAQRLVTVTVKFRDLEKSGVVTEHIFYVRTSGGMRREIDIDAGPGAWYGQQHMYKLTSDNTSGATVRCTGMTHAIDYVKHKVTLTVPRSCLGRPRWVEVSEGTVRVVNERTATGTTNKAYADDAFSPYVSDQLHWSPEVHRG